jgi:hypothetical protein
MCQCAWRTLFDRNDIYPLSIAVDDPMKIFEALRIWIQRADSLEQLKEWSSKEINLLIDVVEQVSVNSGLEIINKAYDSTDNGHS